MKLGQAERAVYLMLEGGPMTPEKSALFKRTLTGMVAAKLVRRREDGGHELVAPGYGPPLPRESVAPPPPPAAPPEPETITVSVRLPANVVAVLDSMGAPNRSEAVRAVLARAVGSGTRRRVAS